MLSERGSLIKSLQQITDENGNSIIDLMEEIYLSRGEHLFERGDKPDALYIVLAGRINCTLTTDQQTIVLDTVSKGETIGEMEVISGETRKLTASAVTSVRLLKLSQTLFQKYCQQTPEVMFDLINLLIARTSQRIKLMTATPEHIHIGLIAASNDADLIQVKKYFTAEDMSRYQLHFVSSADHKKSGMPLQDWLDQQDQPEKIILYQILQDDETEWITATAKRIDCLLVIAQGDQRASLAPLSHDILHDTFDFKGIARKILLIQPDNITMPRNTRDWLGKSDFVSHYHCRLNNDADRHYCARMLSNQATALVLAGGGAKGWAHIGLFKMLYEQNIAIDVIGGTSIGALTGCIYLLSHSYDEVYSAFAKMSRALNKAFSWRNFTWPLVSLFSGAAGHECNTSVFGDLRIEDLWRPFFCMSCNLNRSTEVVHQRDRIAVALRASTSLPGLVPPIVQNGEIYVDGGLMNNLPVDVMRKHVGPRAKIIAADLNHNALDTARYYFPPVLTLKDTLLARLGLANRHYSFPSITESFIRAILLGATAKEIDNSALADIIIKPNLGKSSLLNFNNSDLPLEQGYIEALRAIKLAEVELAQYNQGHPWLTQI